MRDPRSNSQEAPQRTPNPSNGGDKVVPAAAWRADPYLHLGPESVFNPHTDRHLTADDPRFRLLQSLLNQPKTTDLANRDLESLAAEGWLIGSETNPDRLYRLKYISLEAHTVCNQKCYFCPVSVAPRDALYMPIELYQRIVGEIADLGEPIEAVFMNGYNDPTTDPRFIDLVTCMKNAGLPAAVLTNGAGLTPPRADQLLELGGLAYLCINLSTPDHDRYRQDRGHDHLDIVLKNLDYIQNLPVAPVMEIVVLGDEDPQHLEDHQELTARFANSRFVVRRAKIDDRAAYFPTSTEESVDIDTLGGCQLMGSRPIQHLHINPAGQCILCCQDYNETEIVGDLTQDSLKEILEGPAFVQARRRVYGFEDVPDDFICNRCRFALKR